LPRKIDNKGKRKKRGVSKILNKKKKKKLQHYAYFPAHNFKILSNT